jgi:hypothetical protein
VNTNQTTSDSVKFVVHHEPAEAHLWDAFVKKCPDAHFEQTIGWGKLKQIYSCRIWVRIQIPLLHSLHFHKKPELLPSSTNTVITVPWGHGIASWRDARGRWCFWKAFVNTLAD